MNLLLIVLCLILLGIVVVQIGRVTELSDRIRGEAEAQKSTNFWNSRLMMVFMIGLVVLTFWSMNKYENYMLGYGPHEAASLHGVALDGLFNATVIVTMFVFVVTQVLLFYFTYKYRDRDGRGPSLFMPHDNRLEVIWTAVPAIVMTFLVIQGISVWNEATADIDENEDYIEMEATGFQFGWALRYPGADGKLGSRNFKRITGSNPLGQIWEDVANHDDFHPSEIVLPKGKKVRVRITARDVLHNFNLPHFRLKMDAVPGMPTYFVFTPSVTTAEYRQKLRDYPEYQVPYDDEEPDGPEYWEAFEYELACAELCGIGHFSMRKIVRIVEEDEYNDWLKAQTSYYLQNIRNGDEDPFKGQVVDLEIKERSKEFTSMFNSALAAEKEEDRILKLDYIYFETGSDRLKEVSKYQLTDVANALKSGDSLSIEVLGHTDSTGDDASNMVLSQARAKAVKSFLIGQGIVEDRMIAKGYGETSPVESNETEEGRAANRRTELKLL